MEKDNVYKQIVKKYIENHRGLTCQDLIKFCFQGCFGPKHLTMDKDAAYAYFLEEFNQVEAVQGELFEAISQDYMLVHFAPCKYRDLSPKWLFEMFYSTAKEDIAVEMTLEEAFRSVEGVLEESDGNITAEQWRCATKEYMQQEPLPVHHSDSYKAIENPHYRVVAKRYEKVLPILLLMQEKQGVEKKKLTYEYQEDYTGELVAVPVEQRKEDVLVLAIEGRAAAGKSTLAADLAAITKYPIIKMDHFFLPTSLKKPRRLQEPGGNIHYERFKEEVVANIKDDVPFSYGIFDCSTGGLNGTEVIPAARWRIVEGVYSLHPKFGDYADLKIFVDINPEEQMRRIRNRNGMQMARIFRETWIPMEEVYFHKYKQEKNVDYICK